MDERIEAIVNGLERLPTLPGIAMKILEAVKKEEPNLKEIGDILSMDPPLSAEVLKIINSPFYGLSKKVTSVSHAVSMLGINAVKNLALGFSLLRNYRRGIQGGFEYTSFWKDSLIGALACRLLTGKILPAREEDSFALGLLHNIGILVLGRCMPDQYGLILKEKDKTRCSDHEAEKQVLGFSHMDIGGHLIRKWGLPELFHRPIRFHHNVDNEDSNDPEIATLTRILHITSLFIDLFRMPEKSTLLGLLDEYSRSYGFSEAFETDEVAKEVWEQAKSVFPHFEMEMGADEDYSRMIDSARRELISVSSDFMGRFLEQKRLIEQLREKSVRDGLTGLYNYQRFHESLEEEVYRSRRYDFPVSVVICDIDLFKRVNDTYGHLAGDHVLKCVARCLSETLRKSDDVARYGGEEFAIIMPETPAQGALVATERLKEAVEALRISYDGAHIQVTMSFGIATLSGKAFVAKEEVLKRADKALYQAKRDGRNRCCLFRSSSEKAKIRGGSAGKSVPFHSSSKKASLAGIPA
jgi:diguanylate cyclase (GGDEF)-like protein